jgi:hypothetical protein
VLTMRNYKKKTSRGSVPKDIMDTAAELVVKNGESLRKVAEQFKINHCTLFHYCKKVKYTLESDPEKAFGEGISVGFAKPSKVFTEIEECELVEYIVASSNIPGSLSPKEIKTLAYKYCLKINKDVPPSWSKNKIAGHDWFTRFLKTNQQLCLLISLAQATNFNKRKVHTFLLIII